MTTEEMVDWLVRQYPGTTVNLEYAHSRVDLGDSEPYAYVCVSRNDKELYVDEKGNEIINGSYDTEGALELCYWSYGCDLHDVVEYLYNKVKERKDGNH